VTNEAKLDRPSRAAFTAESPPERGGLRSQPCETSNLRYQPVDTLYTYRYNTHSLFRVDSVKVTKISFKTRLQETPE